MNGKDIILQRLRNNKNIKKYRFLGNELQNKVFDLLSSKYLTYRIDELNFVFSTIKFNKTRADIEKKIKPNWMSQSSFNHLIKIKSDLKFKKELESAISKYDKRTSKYFSNFIHFCDENEDSLLKKGQNCLYLVKNLISGKLADGTEFRAPFAFNEVEKLEIDYQSGKVIIKPSNKILINVPFISWVGNKLNYETETLIRNINSVSIEQDYISEFLEIYKKLKIKIDKKYFGNIPNQLKFCREDISIKDVENVALHESLHLVCALHYGFDVDMVDINKENDVMGQVWVSADNNDANLENIITLTIAPYLNSKKDITYQYISEHTEVPDFVDICKNLDRLTAIIDEKQNIFNKCLSNAGDIAKKYDKQIQTFLKVLVEKKTLTNDEILTIWDGQDINIESPKNELKFEPNKFVVEEVRLLVSCPEIFELEIFKDVEEIFKKTQFIENLLNSDLNKKPTNKIDESKIAWGFKADFSQQKAVYDTLLNENSIIQGPPGTGKTQTILNIISNAVTNNKKVLVVAEKTTALQVINDRIKEYAPLLNNFIFDLYNANKLGIEFYRQLGKKIHHVCSEKNVNKAHYNRPTSLQQKVDKISFIGSEIFKLGIISLWDKANDINLTKNDINLINSLLTINLEILKKYDDKTVEKIKEWEKQKNQFITFKNKYFPQNISEDRMKLLYDLNKNEPYTLYNSYKYSSLLLRNKPKANIFIRNKYRKLAREFKLDEIFQNQFKQFSDFFTFDFKHYNPNDFDAIKDLDQIKKSHCSLERVLKIKDFLSNKSNYNNIISLLNETNILEFNDLNSPENFIELHKTIFSTIKKKIFNSSSISRYRDDIRELECCVSRQKMTKIVKSMIKNHWDFLYNFFPVVLTTPELLSHYIPNIKNLYDIVVIDEASQFLIEKSIPALYRGKTRIISGDSQQLRPKINTRFSSTEWNGHEKVEYHQLVESESVLDLFEKLFGDSGTMLTTHYRSEKNELIKFSNDNFYEGKLNFIERADCLNKKNAIEVVDVNGKWIDQCNQEEANEIINRLTDIYKDNKNASVGVIVFSKKQATMIRKILLKSSPSKTMDVLKSFRSFEPNTLFIKSIDEVQGEERDIIIFGITYGNNVHNYMLLSDDYAKNKINVAITRARQKIIIIKSHKSNEYHRISTHNGYSGPETLFNFLAYAEEISKNCTEDSNKIELSRIDKDFLDYLMKKMKKSYDDVKILAIRDKKFFIVNNNEKLNAYFVVDEHTMDDARNKIWFYESLFNTRGYICKPILITDLYKVNF